MATYTFQPSSSSQEADWGDAAFWVGGVVPNSPDADVDFPVVTQTSTGEPYTTEVAVAAGESFAVRSVVLNDFLSISGSLSVAGSITQNANGEIDLFGGSLTAGSIQNGAYDIQGDGQLTVGTLTNTTLIIGGNLSVNVDTLVNTGVLAASEGTTSIVVGAGGASDLAHGALSAGELYALPDGVLALQTESLLTVDAADIVLSGNGTITSRDPASGQDVALTASLQTVAAGGALVVETNATEQFATLAVAGSLTVNASQVEAASLTVSGTLALQSGEVGASNLTVASGGQLTGSGEVLTPVENDGLIQAGQAGMGVLTLAGAVAGTGALEVGLGGADAGKGATYGPTLEIGGATAENVAFEDGLGVLKLDQPSSFTGAITTAGSGDTLILEGVAASSITGVSYAGDASGGTLTLQEASGAVTLHFLGAHAVGDFQLQAGPQPLSSDPPSLEITVAPAGLVPAQTPPALTGFSVQPTTGADPPSLTISATTADGLGIASIQVNLDRALDLNGDTVYAPETAHSAPSYTPTSASISTLELTGPQQLDLTTSPSGAETWLSPEQNFSFSPDNALQTSPDGVVTWTVGAPLKSDDFGAYAIDSVTVTDQYGRTETYNASELASLGFTTSFDITDPGALGTAYTISGSDQSLVAPVSGQAYFEADGTNDRVILNGNVGDYVLSRVQPTTQSGASDSQVGAFLLTAVNGSGAYAIEEGVSTVQFQDGQYLSVKDLPAYVHGSADLQTGGSGADLLFQNAAEPYQLFVGGAGSDTVYLDGNVGDYTLQPFNALTPLGTNGTGGQTYSGLELVAKNGSGLLLIDSSVETVQFQDGQYLAYGDLHSYVAASASPSAVTLDINLPGDFNEPLAYQGAPGNNVALLNGNVGDYTLSRDAAGDFVLDEHYATNGVEDTLTISQSVTAVQFRDGQYLSLKDLGAYIAGSDVFTQGTSGADLLFVPASGDSYVTGGGGSDNLYLNGNTKDYTIQAVDLAATASHPAIDGYELVADNNSGNIYIDQSVGTIHFQNGQYLSFHDLTAYIAP